MVIIYDIKFLRVRVILAFVATLTKESSTSLVAIYSYWSTVNMDNMAERNFGRKGRRMEMPKRRKIIVATNPSNHHFVAFDFADVFKIGN